MQTVLKLIVLIFVSTLCFCAQDEKMRFDYISMLTGLIFTFFIKEIKPKKKKKNKKESSGGENTENK